MKKKILFLSPLPPPHYGSALSSEMCLKILKEDKFFEVRNIKLNYSKEMSDVGHFNMAKINGFLKVKKEISRVMQEFSPDLIYFVPATSGLGLIRDSFFVSQLKRYNLPIIFHVRSRISPKDRKNRLFFSLYKKMFNGEKVIVLGKELEEDIVQFVKKQDLFVLPNAIGNEVSEKELKKIVNKRFLRDSFNLLFLSNMDLSKGWFKLLEACKILKENGKNFKAFFVGEWPGKKEEIMFNNFLQKNSLANNVIYLGKKVGKEKNDILKDADVFVFPTEYKLETFGRVIVEAMMFGLPVIANSVATIPSTVQENKTGFLLKKNTPEEIAETIEKLSNKKLRKNFGLSGRKIFLKEFELKEYSKKFKKILSSI